MLCCVTPCYAVLHCVMLCYTVLHCYAMCSPHSNLDNPNGGCVFMPQWQAYSCKNLQHHMFVIESMDADTETRRLSPIALDGGNTGNGDYTDLLNGPMDHGEPANLDTPSSDKHESHLVIRTFPHYHTPTPSHPTPSPFTGWCTYYTCLKRLSTFFSLVAVGTDYCVWMTGSSPSHLRFHLLNAGQSDSIKLCVWFKTTLRKDVYKVSAWRREGGREGGRAGGEYMAYSC